MTGTILTRPAGGRRPDPLAVRPRALPPARTDVPLLAVAHGTADAAGLAVLGELLARVRLLRPGLRTPLAFVSVAEPRPEQALAELAAEGAAEVVLLPLFLGSGYHVRHDIPRAVRHGAALPGRPLTIHTAPALGPDPLLAAVLAERLAEVGGTVFGTQVVLAAAGSADRRANADAVAMAGMLAERLGTPVRTAYVTTAEPGVAALLGRLVRRGRPVSVATYLLSSGEFSRRIEHCATLAALEADLPRAPRVAAPLGAHDQVARLMLRRYDHALAPRSPAG